jgi:putative glycosyltransferase (TIGR04348 family)
LGRLSHLRQIDLRVNIQLVTPAPLRLNNGNKITAVRWAAMLKQLGHRVRVTQSYDGDECDLLIALHARRSADSIRRFRRLHPDLPLVVVLTGTDLYRDIHNDRQAKESLELASRLVVLQRMGLRELPGRLRAKTRVIYQSSEPLDGAATGRGKLFRICLIAHLRREKDPLRAALAARRLPKDSRIRIIHIGLSLDEKLTEKARTEALRNPRYRWLGQRSHRQTRKLLAQSRLLCITSKMEGSSNVLSEALASDVPVVATRIPGLVGTLDEDFPGYFPVGDTDALRNLLIRAERDPVFYRRLKKHCRRAAKWVRPARERASWRRLLQDLAKRNSQRR